MIYMNSGGYLLQDKGKEKEGKFSMLSLTRYSMMYGNVQFPITTDEFLLFALSSEYDYSNSKNYNSLLLIPPMNSYRIKQRRTGNYKNHEIYLHFNDKYILNIEYSYQVSIQVYLLNGEIVQTVEIQQNGIYSCHFSQSGEYMVVLTQVSSSDRQSV